MSGFPHPTFFFRYFCPVKILVPPSSKQRNLHENGEQKKTLLSHLSWFVHSSASHVWEGGIKELNLWPRKDERMGPHIPRGNFIHLLARRLPSFPSSVFPENNFGPMATQLPSLCPLPTPRPTDDRTKRQLLFTVSLP